MKLNRKGFVITAILYGLLLLFVMLVSSYLLVLSARKNRLDNIVKEVEGKYSQHIVHVILTDSSSDFSNNTIYRLDNGNMEDEGGNKKGYEGDFVVNNNGTLKIQNIIPSDSEQGWFLCDDNTCNTIFCSSKNSGLQNIPRDNPNKFSYSNIDENEDYLYNACESRNGSDKIKSITFYNINKNMTCYINFIYLEQEKIETFCSTRQGQH